ncbi:hypothetical protein C8R43DRAFT_953567 [Mycena crocata]|nr:hypothetical protein C8R43DRAFT_953567 [Mycena crocata]
MSSGDLRAQGNALFVARKFKEADKKYTEAIQAGDEEAADPALVLAVLFADAMGDALKATKLDPTYSKAHARLGSACDALGNHATSEKSWQLALDTLPKSNLTQGEKLQKEQYEAALKAVKSQLHTSNIRILPPVVAATDGQQPWNRAAAIIPQLNPDTHSSTWVIRGAYEVGLRDWMRGGPAVMIEEALARQRGEGWHAVRTSLALYIRQVSASAFHCDGSLTVSLILRGVIEVTTRRRYDLAVELYKHALDVLRSLKETWSEVPEEDLGDIFRMHIDAIMQAHVSNPSLELLEDLLKESDCLIHEVDDALQATPPEQDDTMIRLIRPEDIGHSNSFYVYPRALTYAMKGYYYNKTADLKPTEKREFYRKAALEYRTSAGFFPLDDEQHAWFLKMALKNMLKAHSFSVGETLEVMKRITESTLKAKKIWEYSDCGANGLWDTLDEVKQQEEELRRRVARGKIKRDTCIGPDDV